jgi:hypothetical protein
VRGGLEAVGPDAEPIPARGRRRQAVRAAARRARDPARRRHVDEPDLAGVDRAVDADGTGPREPDLPTSAGPVDPEIEGVRSRVRERAVEERIVVHEPDVVAGRDRNEARLEPRGRVVEPERLAPHARRRRVHRLQVDDRAREIRDGQRAVLGEQVAAQHRAARLWPRPERRAAEARRGEEYAGDAQVEHPGRDAFSSAARASRASQGVVALAERSPARRGAVRRCGSRTRPRGAALRRPVRARR